MEKSLKCIDYLPFLLSQHISIVELKHLCLGYHSIEVFVNFLVEVQAK